MRVPIEAYLRGQGAKVYSLVVSVPFSPLDIDLGYLTRGQWNVLTDRFRLWHLPAENGSDRGPICYLMVRKFDPKDGVIVYGHMVVDTEHKANDDGRNFTVGIMSNDEVRARVMLNSMLDIPPSFHRRSELRPIEKRWRSDPEAVMRFLANIHSAMANLTPNRSGKVYTLKFEPPPGLMGELTRNIGAWW